MQSHTIKVNNKVKRGKISVLKIILFAVLSVYTLSLFVLLFWGLLSSFKEAFDFRSNNLFGWPDPWVWSNYATAFARMSVEIPYGAGTRFVYLEEMFLNSILYAVGCAAAHALTACIVAYMTVKYKYWFSKVIYTVVIVAMALPIIGALPSEINVVRTLGLYDSIVGQWVMKANFLGTYFLVFHATFRVMPNEFFEAARVDGAGNLKRMLIIALPLASKTILTVMLLQFIVYWNDYQIPLIYLPSYPTVSQGLYSFSLVSTDNELSTVPMRLTGCMLLMLPILVVFIVFRNKLIGNISMGGLKE